MNDNIKVDISCASIIPKFVYNYFKSKIKDNKDNLNYLTTLNSDKNSSDLNDYMHYKIDENENIVKERNSNEYTNA